MRHSKSARMRVRARGPRLWMWAAGRGCIARARVRRRSSLWLLVPMSTLYVLLLVFFFVVVNCAVFASFHLTSPFAQCDDRGITPLHAQCKAGREEVIAALLQAGANPNATDAEQQRPLHVAARFGHDGALSLLIAARAALDGRDAHGRTALMLAVEHAHPVCVRVLMAAGARWDVQLLNRTIVGTPAATLRARMGFPGAADSVGTPR